MEAPTDRTLCFNCSAPKESADAVFCAYCGQKHGTGRIALGDIARELVSNIFNLDSKTIRTAAALFYPGKLTVEYFKGKHKMYSHPIRLFFVGAIFFFAAIASDVGGSLNSDSTLPTAINDFLERSNTLILIDSLRSEVNPEHPSPAAQTALDSLISQIRANYYPNVETDTIRLGDFIRMSGDSLFIREQYLPPLEFKNADPKVLVEKYLPEMSFIEKVATRQGIKVLRNGGSMLDFMLGKVPLMLLVMMPFLALFLKLLYIRHKIFFIEHLFFSFHLHAFIFFLGTLLLLLSNILSESWIALMTLSIFVYLFLALKKVYGQGFWKTLLKFWTLLVFYIVLVCLFAVLFSIISFLLF